MLHFYHLTLPAARQSRNSFGFPSTEIPAALPQGSWGRCVRKGALGPFPLLPQGPDDTTVVAVAPTPGVNAQEISGCHVSPSCPQFFHFLWAFPTMFLAEGHPKIQRAISQQSCVPTWWQPCLCSGGPKDSLGPPDFGLCPRETTDTGTGLAGR